MKKAKIVIVEDEFIICEEMICILENLGYEVIATTDSAEKAIELLEMQTPDLVLVDIRLKGEMDGIEAAKIIRNRFNIPVVFSTAYLDQERIERAKITMPFGYLLKPIQERDLRVTLEMALYIANVDRERIKMETSLKEYEKVVESSQDIIAVVDENYRYVMTNKSFLEYNDTSKQAVLGAKVSAILGKEVFEKSVKPNIDRALKGENVHFELSVHYSKHGERHMLVNYHPINAENSPNNRVVAIIKDITKRKQYELELSQHNIRLEEQVQKRTIDLQNEVYKHKQTEKALRESEKKFRILFEQAADSLVLVDADSQRIVDCNDIAHKKLGYTREEFCKLKVQDLEIVESHQEVTQHAEKIKQTGSDTFETKLRAKSGEIQEYLMKIRSISIDHKDFLLSIWHGLEEK